MLKIKDLQRLIVEIQHYEMELFEALDEDYPDNRIVRAKERAIYNRLDKITNDIVLKEKIRLCIQQGMWNTKDYTFKPIFDNLRNIGLEV
jgi:hypothetical protein